METSAAILPAAPARLPGLSSSSSDEDLGSHPSSDSCPPSRPSVQPVRWKPRQLSFQRVLGAFQAFQASRPAGPKETSAAGDGVNMYVNNSRTRGLSSRTASSQDLALQPSSHFVQIRRRTPRRLVIRRILGALPGLPASSGDRDLGSHPSSASRPPSRPSGQLRRWRPRRPVTVLTTVLITRRTHELSSRAASSRPPAFQASRPAGPMETSPAGLPARPGRLPSLPGLSSSSGDGDLGSYPSSASCPPSRPSGQLRRWRPRQLSFQRILPAFQASRPAGPMETSAAILPAHPGRLPGLPSSRSDGDSATIPPAHPGRSIAPGPFAQIRRRRARPPVIQRILPTFQAFRPAPAMETSAAILPAHPGHRSGLPASRSDGSLGSSPSSASWAPLRPSGQPVRWTPRRPSFQRLLHAFQVSRPAGPMETSAATLPAAPAHLPGLPSGSIDEELARR